MHLKLKVPLKQFQCHCRSHSTFKHLISVALYFEQLQSVAAELMRSIKKNLAPHPSADKKTSAFLG